MAAMLSSWQQPAVGEVFPAEFTIAVGIIFGLVLLVSAGIYAFGHRLPGWNALRVRMAQRFALSAALLSAFGLVIILLGILGVMEGFSEIVALALLVAIFTLAGYTAYYFYRVYPPIAARWRAEEARRQIASKPKPHVVARPASKKKSRRRR